MSRLSVEILEQCPHRINPLQKKELVLRAKGIRQLEEEPLSLLHDGFDAVDVSRNALLSLDGFPQMPRLTQIIAHGNLMCRVSKSATRNLPNLESFVAHDNQFKSLAELENFALFPKLRRISLLGNPVTSVANYRLFLISRCPTLKLIDFQRVLDSERAQALVEFPPTSRATKSGKRARGATDGAATVADSGAGGGAAAGRQAAAGETLSHEEYAKQKLDLEARLEAAETMEEIGAIEEAIEELERKKPRK